MPDAPANKPAISLIITAYNRADYIAAAIGSVLRQTRKDFELVVWDDESTDNTVEVAKRAAGTDPRVRIVVGRHGGMAAGLNGAAKLLSAPYFGWVDSDDALAPTALEETAAILDARPEIGMVYTNYMTINQSGKVMGLGSRTKIPYSKDRMLVDFMTFHFRLVRRELFDRAGGADTTQTYALDYDLCLKWSEMADVYHLKKPLYFYRVHPDTISAAKRLEQIEASRITVERALVRRGLSAQYELDVEIIGRFKLKKKQPSPGARVTPQ